MLKKLMAVLLAASIIMTGTTAFAAGTRREEIKAKISEKVEKVQTIKQNSAEVKPLIETIRTNKAQLIKLRANARAEYIKAKNKVKVLLKDKETLTPEQIEALSQAANTLSQDKEQLKGTIGDIQKENQTLKDARKNKNTEEYKQALNNIITIQNIRMENLKKIIDDMQKVSAI